MGSKTMVMICDFLGNLAVLGTELQIPVLLKPLSMWNTAEETSLLPHCLMCKLIFGFLLGKHQNLIIESKCWQHKAFIIWFQMEKIDPSTWSLKPFGLTPRGSPLSLSQQSIMWSGSNGILVCLPDIVIAGLSETARWQGSASLYVTFSSHHTASTSNCSITSGAELKQSEGSCHFISTFTSGYIHQKPYRPDVTDY